MNIFPSLVPTVVPCTMVPSVFSHWRGGVSFPGSTTNPRLKHWALSSYERYDETFPATISDLINSWSFPTISGLSFIKFPISAGVIFALIFSRILLAKSVSVTSFGLPIIRALLLIILWSSAKRVPPLLIWLKATTPVNPSLNVSPNWCTLSLVSPPETIALNCSITCDFEIPYCFAKASAIFS